jgi:hypothetical protein
MLDTSLEDALKYHLKCSDFIVMDCDREIAPIKVSYGSSPEQLSKIDCGGLKGDRWFNPLYVSPDFSEYTGSVLYVDPAGRGRDRTGFAVVKTLNGMLFIRRLGGLEGGYDKPSLEALAHIARAEKVNKVVVEKNFGDGMFLQLLKPVMEKIYPVSLEEDSAVGQKELRIIDTLEPLLNQHRIVIDPNVIKTDLTQETQHSFQYQLTRLTKDRGCLQHDDVLDALAGACRYWTTKLDLNIEDAEDRHRLEAIHREADRWLEEMTGKKPSGPNWADGLRGR